MPVDELLTVALAYLVGSVPVGYLLVRLRTGRDLRLSGSGSTGASNAARLLGRPGFAAVFVLDLLKGSAAVLLASSFADARWAAAGAGIAAVAGHLWPIWLGFRGGKGLATGFGACLVFSPLVAALALVTLGVLLPVLRPPLVALVAALMLAPLYALVLDREAAIGVLFMAILVLTGHRRNIRALLPGGADHARVAVGWADRPPVRPTAGRSKR